VLSVSWGESCREGELEGTESGGSGDVALHCTWDGALDLDVALDKASDGDADVETETKCDIFINIKLVSLG
jgi:hypothetical protein